MTDNVNAFNKSSFLNDFWLHAFIIIPIEFGILHSTPLGPMLSGWFESLWSAVGFDFTGHAAVHTTAEIAPEIVAPTIAPAKPPSFTTPITPGKFCHMHGVELACH